MCNDGVTMRFHKAAPVYNAMRAILVDPAQITPLTQKSRSGSRGAKTILTPLTIDDIPTPEPPAPAWVRVRPALSGMCAKDIAFLSGADLSSPIGVYHPRKPFVLGHEVVGVVEESRKTRSVREGDRVIIEPSLFCFHKGLPPCRQCQHGNVHLCENRFREGPLCSGSSIGFSPELGGGWSEGFLAHESMLIPVHDIPDQRAVMAEPLASALHAIMKWSGEGDTALVIGSGTMSRLFVLLLSTLYPTLEIGVVYERRSAIREHRSKHQRTIPAQFAPPPDIDVGAIRALGAKHIWRAPSEEIINAIAEWVGACRLRATGDSLPLLDRGVDVIFDCRTTSETTDMAVRVLRPGGTLVLVGRGLPSQTTDWSYAWHNELQIVGSSSYGREATGARTFARAKELLADPALQLDQFVTHRYPLEMYEEALTTAQTGTGASAIKVVLEGPAAVMREREVTSSTAHSPEEELEPPVILAAAAKRARHRSAEDADD